MKAWTSFRVGAPPVGRRPQVGHRKGNKAAVHFTRGRCAPRVSDGIAVGKASVCRRLRSGCVSGETAVTHLPSRPAGTPQPYRPHKEGGTKEQRPSGRALPGPVAPSRSSGGTDADVGAQRSQGSREVALYRLLSPPVY